MLRTLTQEPIPDDLPMVLIVPKEAMPCPCEAAYDKGQLYIRNDINWTDPRWLSIVPMRGRRSTRSCTRMSCAA